MTLQQVDYKLLVGVELMRLTVLGHDFCVLINYLVRLHCSEYFLQDHAVQLEATHVPIVSQQIKSFFEDLAEEELIETR